MSMDMPCPCPCGEVFDLVDGNPCHKCNSTFCTECSEHHSEHGWICRSCKDNINVGKCQMCIDAMPAIAAPDADSICDICSKELCQTCGEFDEVKVDGELAMVCLSCRENDFPTHNDIKDGAR